jgi:hypothetical protein
MVATGVLRRTSFGLPRARRSRAATLLWAAVVLLLAVLALGLRAVRWADRNL